MMRGIFTILTFLSAVIFPWPVTAILAIGLSPFEPLVPLAVGIFADTLYYMPHSVPLYALSGALVTSIAFLVRTRLKTSIIGG